MVCEKNLCARRSKHEPGRPASLGQPAWPDSARVLGARGLALSRELHSHKFNIPNFDPDGGPEEIRGTSSLVVSYLVVRFV